MLTLFNPDQPLECQNIYLDNLSPELVMQAKFRHLNLALLFYINAIRTNRLYRVFGVLLKKEMIMQELTAIEVGAVSGGMRWEGNRMSENVIDRRGFFSRDTNGDIMWGDTFYNHVSMLMCWW